MTKTLEQMGYLVTDNAKKRRRTLKAIRKKIGQDKLESRLQSRKNRATGYKQNRYRADLNFVRKQRKTRTTGFKLSGFNPSELV